MGSKAQPPALQPLQIQAGGPAIPDPLLADAPAGLKDLHTSRAAAEVAVWVYRGLSEAAAIRRDSMLQKLLPSPCVGKFGCCRCCCNSTAALGVLMLLLLLLTPLAYE